MPWRSPNAESCNQRSPRPGTHLGPARPQAQLVLLPISPCSATQAAGYEGKVKIGMDVAASEFMTEDGKYDLDFKNKPNDGSQVKTGCVRADADF